MLKNWLLEILCTCTNLNKEAGLFRQLYLRCHQLSLMKIEPKFCSPIIDKNTSSVIRPNIFHTPLYLALNYLWLIINYFERLYDFNYLGKVLGK